jgi:hypothetical protein
MITPPASPTAWAQLLEDVGHALLRFADTIREEDGQAAAPAGVPHRRRGELQSRVLELPGFDDVTGLAAREVAEQLGVAPSNAQRTLNTLTGQGLLERLPRERPYRWRRGDGR